MTSNPNPTVWTLRLKHAKTTILLHVNPLHTFSHIKTVLLHALRETRLHNGNGVEIALPDSADQIQFGRPIDVTDPSAGFQLGEWETGPDFLEGEDGSAATGQKGKGKAKAMSKTAGNGGEGDELAGAENIKQCPKGAGLRDGSVLAFRWRRDDEDEDELAAGNDWSVVFASFEDVYGVTNEMDAGGRKEFQG